MQLNFGACWMCLLPYILSTCTLNGAAVQGTTYWVISKYRVQGAGIQLSATEKNGYELG